LYYLAIVLLLVKKRSERSKLLPGSAAITEYKIKLTNSNIGKESFSKIAIKI